MNSNAANSNLVNSANFPNQHNANNSLFSTNINAAAAAQLDLNPNSNEMVGSVVGNPMSVYNENENSNHSMSNFDRQQDELDAYRIRLEQQEMFLQYNDEYEHGKETKGKRTNFI